MDPAPAAGVGRVAEYPLAGLVGLAVEAPTIGSGDLEGPSRGHVACGEFLGSVAECSGCSDPDAALDLAWVRCDVDVFGCVVAACGPSVGQVRGVGFWVPSTRQVVGAVHAGELACDWVDQALLGHPAPPGCCVDLLPLSIPHERVVDCGVPDADDL